MSVRAAVEGGLTLYVRVAGGFLPIEPAIRPDSAMRFHRGVAPRFATWRAGNLRWRARALTKASPPGSLAAVGLEEGPGIA